MILHLFLVRHGQTEFNRYNRLQGWSNSPLTDKGMEDARRAGFKLAHVPFAAAYCSDTTRAQITAGTILDLNESGAPRPTLISDMHFREQHYGYYEGQDMNMAWWAAGAPHGAKTYNEIVDATSSKRPIHSMTRSPMRSTGGASPADTNSSHRTPR